MGAVPMPTADPRARPIGVFDSGVGGLTVLHELLVQLPHEDFLYLGDTARFPYGDRPAEELERFALEIAATVASGAYARAVHAADPHVDLVSVPCPDLAPIIQAGSAVDEAVLEVVRGYVAPLREAEADTVILGCTHYPLVRPM